MQLRGPYIIIEGDRKTLWKDAETYFKNVWICAERDIDFWVKTSYRRTDKEVIFKCIVTVGKELQNILTNNN